MLRDVLGWIDVLLAPRQERNIVNATWTNWHNELHCISSEGSNDTCNARPADMLGIHCHADICVFRKAYR